MTWLMLLYLRADPWFEDSTAAAVGFCGLCAGFWIRVPNLEKDSGVKRVGLT